MNSMYMAAGIVSFGLLAIMGVGVWRATKMIEKSGLDPMKNSWADYVSVVIKPVAVPFLGVIVAAILMSIVGLVVHRTIGKETVGVTTNVLATGIDAVRGGVAKAGEIVGSVDLEANPVGASDVLEWAQEAHEKANASSGKQSFYVPEAAPANTSGYIATGYSVPAPVQAAPVVVEAAPVQVQSVAPAPVQLVAETTDYRVQAGDTLAALAKRYYGDGELWTVICAANAASLGGGCSNINTGQALIIPALAADATAIRQASVDAASQINALVTNGEMAPVTTVQVPAQAVMSSAPQGWSTVNNIVTRADYDTAVANSSQAGLPVEPTPSGAMASWTVIK